MRQITILVRRLRLPSAPQAAAWGVALVVGIEAFKEFWRWLAAP